MHNLHFVICAISILLNAEKNMAAIHKLEDIVWLKTCSGKKGKKPWFCWPLC